jgi:hypothetical protein
VSGQPHASGALPQEEPPVPSELEAVHITDLVKMIAERKREKNQCLKAFLGNLFSQPLMLLYYFRSDLLHRRENS